MSCNHLRRKRLKTGSACWMAGPGPANPAADQLIRVTRVLVEMVVRVIGLVALASRMVRL